MMRIAALLLCVLLMHGCAPALTGTPIAQNAEPLPLPSETPAIHAVMYAGPETTFAFREALSTVRFAGEGADGVTLEFVRVGDAATFCCELRLLSQGAAPASVQITSVFPWDSSFSAQFADLDGDGEDELIIRLYYGSDDSLEVRVFQLSGAALRQVFAATSTWFLQNDVQPTDAIPYYECIDFRPVYHDGVCTLCLTYEADSRFAVDTYALSDGEVSRLARGNAAYDATLFDAAQLVEIAPSMTRAECYGAMYAYQRDTAVTLERTRNAEGTLTLKITTQRGELQLVSKELSTAYPYDCPLWLRCMDVDADGNEEIFIAFEDMESEFMRF
ncbi:MAG: PliI family lysozyme inhibitor of I-type lysozyme [Christensenellaceae bacterium]|jgi:hypothetical protein|nr:PliI family lysozyme inhibitor of I-type lysozyme [Christensenellaceae bacterium]